MSTFSNQISFPWASKLLNYGKKRFLLPVDFIISPPHMKWWTRKESKPLKAATFFLFFKIHYEYFATGTLRNDMVWGKLWYYLSRDTNM